MHLHIYRYIYFTHSTNLGKGNSIHRRRKMGSMRCVVVAVDGSDYSMRALEWALENIKLSTDEESKAKFVVLHVQSPPTISAGLNPGAIPFGGPTYVDVPAFTAAIEAHQNRITEAIMKHAEGIWNKRNVNVEKQVVVGEPKEVICETTSRLQADLLVMGSHAYGTLKSNKAIQHPRFCFAIVMKDTMMICQLHFESDSDKSEMIINLNGSKQ